MVLGRALSWAAERYPEREAIAGPRALTYAEWDRRTNALARGLGELGAARGDRVAIIAANGEPAGSTHLACQKLGATSVPLNVRYAPDELAYCLRDSRPRVIVYDDGTADVVHAALGRLDDAPVLVHAGDTPAGDGTRRFESLIDASGPGPLDVAVGPSDISVMLYTAGTTGRPKGVPRRHHAEVHAGLAHVVQAGYGPGESTLCAMPMYHTMGLRSLVAMLLVGGTTAFLESFEPARALEVIAREQVSSLFLVPTAFWSLVHEPGAPDACTSVRKLAYAGAAMTQALTEQVAVALEPDVFVNHYGSTEIYTFSTEQNARARPGSAGRPGMFTRLGIVVADAERRVGPDERVEPGQTGEIIASLDSDEAFAGYWNRPEVDAARLRDGWYFTGDLGSVDDAGDLHISGRIDDMVISGGENVHPLEVEDALTRCADVEEVAVAGVGDDRWGHAVTAFVVVRDGADAEAIARWTRAESGLAAYKRPKRIVILDAIPKSPVGKILRRSLVAGNYVSRGEAAP